VRRKKPVSEVRQQPCVNLAQAGVVVFPLEERVVMNQHGVFVPRSIFGENASVEHHIVKQSDGQVAVTLLGRATEPASPRGAETSPELRWLADHRQEYAGQWVALDGERLVAHGANPRAVYCAARNAGLQIPSVLRVELEPELPFVGW
jgi:Family of unknown function (DUF5678)